MQSLTEDYQKILDFICRLDDVDDLRHLFEYLDNFWQSQFGTSPSLIFSKSIKGNETHFREYWNKGKDQIFYTNSDIEIFKKLILDSEAQVHSACIVNESYHFYILNCGEFKGQIYYTCFKIDREIASTVLENLYQFLQTTMRKISRYKEADNLKSLIHIDDVTGHYNQRKFIQDVENIIDEYQKTEHQFSLIFVDIDHFKQVNDGHGHLVGTTLLRDVSKIIKNCVREGDLCYRYGGDEFVVLVPLAGEEEANIIGNRILKGIKEETFEVGEGEGIGDATEFKLSVSIGIATYPTDAKNKVDIINMADKMMYKAKNSGRGRVCSAKDLFSDEIE